MTGLRQLLTTRPALLRSPAEQVRQFGGHGHTCTLGRTLGAGPRSRRRLAACASPHRLATSGVGWASNGGVIGPLPLLMRDADSRVPVPAGAGSHSRPGAGGRARDRGQAAVQLQSFWSALRESERQMHLHRAPEPETRNRNSDDRLSQVSSQFIIYSIIPTAGAGSTQHARDCNYCRNPRRLSAAIELGIRPGFFGDHKRNNIKHPRCR
jgi:hypothetical protein